MKEKIDEEFGQGLFIILSWAPHVLFREFTGFSERILREIETGVLRERIPYLRRALTWAVAHPAADFRSLLPGTRYSNRELFEYLKVVEKQFLERHGRRKAAVKVE